MKMKCKNPKFKHYILEWRGQIVKDDDRYQMFLIDKADNITATSVTSKCKSIDELAFCLHGIMCGGCDHEFTCGGLSVEDTRKWLQERYDNDQVVIW